MLLAAPLLIAAAGALPWVLLAVGLYIVLRALYNSMDFYEWENSDGYSGESAGKYAAAAALGYCDIFGKKSFSGFVSWLSDGMPQVRQRSAWLNGEGIPWWVWLLVAYAAYRILRK